MQRTLPFRTSSAPSSMIALNLVMKEIVFNAEIASPARNRHVNSCSAKICGILISRSCLQYMSYFSTADTIDRATHMLSGESKSDRSFWEIETSSLCSRNEAAACRPSWKMSMNRVKNIRKEVVINKKRNLD